MSSIQIVNRLANSPVLSKLNQRELERLARFVVRKEYRKGEYIAHQGDKYPYVILIERGEIHALKLSSAGRSLGTLKLRDGEEFWSPSLFGGIPLPATLQVWQRGEIYFLHQEKVLPLIQKNAAALWLLSLELAQRLQQRSEFIEEIAFSSVSGRLARLLLNKFQDSEDRYVERDLSLDEMGTIIGTTPVVVCKQISRFAEKGLINVSRTEFQLIDQAALEEIANIK